MRRQNFLSLACLFFGLCLLAIGLCPFNFRADNHAAPAPNAGGLKFEAPAERSKQGLSGMVFTLNPPACRAQSSLAIEQIQAWLPGRGSSFLDLTTNTVGSAIDGAMA